jgi:uncharacterized protein (DUF2267 family)
MDHDQFIELVQEGAGIGREHAERATRATLATLAERIAKGEAIQLAEQLPPELAPWLATQGGPEAFGVDEFVRRVAEREGVDVDTAERDVRAVLDALARAVSPGEFEDTVAELPREFVRLLPRGPYVETIPTREIVARVAERARVDTDTARRAAEAVLETLAERIAGGEVDDLVARLPVALHAPLRRGNERSHGAARRMSLEEFVQRVAELEGVPPSVAREHARAVMATLREVVGEEEFHDITVQLPDEYTVVLARP